MSAKHTPGPWPIETVVTSCGTCHKIGMFPSLGAYTETSACVYADGVRLSDYGQNAIGDELMANARLIAAAPDLLEALEAVVRVADRNTAEFDLAHSAIKKARSES